MIKNLEGDHVKGAIVGDDVKRYILFSNKERSGSVWKMRELDKPFFLVLLKVLL